jgi:hypothetical protein
MYLTGHKKKDAAIAALLVQPTVAAAARAVGVSSQTLGRWMKDPAFDAAYRAAKQANHEQSMARHGRRAVAYVESIRNIVSDPTVKASTRRAAGQFVIREAGHAREMEDFAAEVATVDRASRASQTEGPGVPLRSTGHGAKFPRKKEEAIARLLDCRSVAEAAAACGIGVQTLYQWMKDPAFIAEFQATERAVLAEARRRLQQGLSDALTVVGNQALDPAIPKAARLQAAKYSYRLTKATAMKDLVKQVAAAEPVGEGAESSETGQAGTVIGRNLVQRMERLKTRLVPTTKWFEDGFDLVEAVDGKATSSSVRRFSVWSNPDVERVPNRKKGEPPPGRVAA